MTTKHVQIELTEYELKVLVEVLDWLGKSYYGTTLLNWQLYDRFDHHGWLAYLRFVKKVRKANRRRKKQ